MVIQRRTAGCVRSRSSPRHIIDMMITVNPVERWMRVVKSVKSVAIATSQAAVWITSTEMPTAL